MFSPEQRRHFLNIVHGKIQQGASVQNACRLVARQSNSPAASTLREWYYDDRRKKEQQATEATARQANATERIRSIVADLDAQHPDATPPEELQEPQIVLDNEPHDPPVPSHNEFKAPTAREQLKKAATKIQDIRKQNRDLRLAYRELEETLATYARRPENTGLRAFLRGAQENRHHQNAALLQQVALRLEAAAHPDATRRETEFVAELRQLIGNTAPRSDRYGSLTLRATDRWPAL